MKKNKKRGASFVEIAIVVVIMGVIISIIGPILRYYLQIGNKSRYGVTSNGEQIDSYYRMEEIMASLVLSQSNENQQGKKTAGLGYTTGVLNTINNYDLSGVRGILNNPSNNTASVSGEAVFIEVPTNIKHGTPEKIELGQSFHYFRFGTDGGKLKMLYRNTLDDDGNGKYISGTSKVFIGNEEVLFPGPLSKAKIKSGQFKEVAAGTVMIMEYCDSSKDEQCDTKSTGITRIEKLFLKRGEI